MVRTAFHAATLSMCAMALLSSIAAAETTLPPTVTMVVGSAAGGGFDKYGRLTAKHIKQYLPGRPAIVVSKAAHLVVLYDRGRPIRRYRGDLGYHWVADKQRGGDGATPEGQYRVSDVRERGSAYYKALLIDYPNAHDRRAFDADRRAGAISPTASIGGQIEIHGHGGTGRDWTDGCVALSDTDLDDLLRYVGVDTPVTIVGAMQADEMTNRLKQLVVASAGPSGDGRRGTW